MKNLEEAIHSAINAPIERHLREGTVQGMCLSSVKFGSDMDDVKQAMLNVVNENLRIRREHFLELEGEIDMLLRMKTCI